MSASCSGSQAVIGRKSGLVSVGLVRGSGFSGLVVARACGLGLVGRA